MGGSTTNQMINHIIINQNSPLPFEYRQPFASLICQPWWPWQRDRPFDSYCPAQVVNSIIMSEATGFLGSWSHAHAALSHGWCQGFFLGSTWLIGVINSWGSLMALVKNGSGGRLRHASPWRWFRNGSGDDYSDGWESCSSPILSFVGNVA